MTLEFFGNPLPWQPDALDISRQNADRAKEYMKHWASLEWGPQHAESLSSPDVGGYYMNRGEEISQNRKMTGFMPFARSQSEAMSRDYAGGWTTDNVAFKQDLASDLSYLLKFDGGGMLDVGSRAREIIGETKDFSRWNAISMFSSGFDKQTLPVANSFSSGVEDLLNLDFGDAFKPSQALVEFRKKDFDNYNFFAMQLGGEEALKEIVKDTKNPYDFFRTISNTSRQMEIAQAYGNWVSTATDMDQLWNFASNLTINGIINDPDLVASMAISAGLSVTGVGVIAGAALTSTVLAAKTAKQALRMKRFMQVLHRMENARSITGKAGISERLAAVGDMTRRLVNYLPERVGPHLLAKGIKKATGKDFREAGRIIRWPLNRVSDMAEGAITGSLAEIGNQWRKQNMGLQDGFDWGKVKEEGILEALLSPVINPVFGTAMGAGTLPIAWTAKKWYNAKAKGTGGWINQTVDFWQTVSHPDYVKRTREITRKRGELNRIINRTLNASPVDGVSGASRLNLDLGQAAITDINRGAGEGASDRLSLGLSSIRHLSGLNDSDFHDLLIETANEVLQIHGEFSLSPAQFLEHTLSTLQGTFHDKITAKHGPDVDRVITQMRGWNKHISDMENAAAAESARTGTHITSAQYVQNIKDKQQWTRLLPPDILSGTKKKYSQITRKDGSKVDWDSATEKERFDAGLDYAHELMTKQTEVDAEAIKTINQVRAEATAAGIPTTGEAVQEGSPTNDVVTQSVDAEQTAQEVSNQIDEDSRRETEEMAETETERAEVLGQIRRTRETKGRDAVSEDLLKRRRELKDKLKLHREKIADFKEAKRRIKDLLEKLNIDKQAFLAQLNPDPVVRALGDEVIELRKRLLETYKAFQEAGGAEVDQYLALVRPISALRLVPFMEIDPETGKPMPDKIKKTIKIEDLDNMPGVISALESLLELVESGTTHLKIRQTIKNEINRILKGDPETKLTGGSSKRGSSFTKLINSFNSLATKVEQDFKETDDYKNHTASVKKFEKVHRDYKRELSKLSEERAKQSAVVSFSSVVSHRGLIDQIQRDTKHFEIVIAGAEQRLDALEAEGNITVKELMQLLPDISKWKKKKVADHNTLDHTEKTKRLNRTIPIDKARSIVGETKSLINKLLKDMQLGSLTSFVAPANLQEHLKSQLLELTDADLDNLPYTNWDNLLNESNPGEALKKIRRDINKEAEAWAEWNSRLKALLQSTARNSDGSVHAALVYSTMPEYFWQLGLAPFVLFEPALDGAGLEMEIGERHINAGSLRYNLEKVMDIVDLYRGRVYRKLEGTRAQTLDNLIGEIMRSELDSETKPDSISNFELAVELLKDLEDASRDWNKSQARTIGFVLDVREETGFFDRSQVTRSREAYTQTVEQSIRERLEEQLFMEGGRAHPRARKIMEKLGVEYVPGEPINIDRTFNKIMQSLDVFADDSDSGVVTLSSFGDGTIDWAPATLVGRAIVDYFAFEKITVQADKLVTGEHGLIGTESDMDRKGNPEFVAAAGRINHSAPLGSFDLKRIIMRWQTDQRQKEVLRHIEWDDDLNRPTVKNWGKKQRDAAAKWREKFRKEGTPDPSEDMTKFMIFPRWVGGSLEQGLLNREKAIDLAMHFMMDLPNLAQMFVQDSLAGARDSRIRFNRDFANQLNIPFISPGSEVIVPRGYAGDVIAQAFASEQMAPLASSIIEASIESTNKWLMDEFNMNPQQFLDVTVNGEVVIGDRTITLDEVNEFLYDRTNYYDRVNSGIHENHLNTLAVMTTTGSDNWKHIANTPYGNQPIEVMDDNGNIDKEANTIYKSLVKYGLRTTILNSKRSSISESDFYIKGALAAADAISANGNALVVQRMGPLKAAFDLLGKYDIKSTKDFEAMKKREDISAEEKAVLSKLRDVFKPPVMRRMYGGGLDNFRQEFINEPFGKGTLAVKALAEQMGVTVTSDNIIALGELLYERQDFNDRVILDQVIATDQGMKDAMTGFLSINRSEEFQTRGVLDFINKAERARQVSREIRQDKPGVERTLPDVVVIDRDTGETHTIPFTQPEAAELRTDEALPEDDRSVSESLYNLSDLRRTIKDRLRIIARDSNQKIETVEENYAPMLAKAEAKFREWEEDGNMDMNDARWNEIHQIFLPENDLNHKELAFFRGLNMMTASHFRINMDRAKDVAKAFNVEWTEDELSGLGNVFLYGRIGPTADHHRGLAVGGHIPNHTATSFSRVAVLPDPMKDGKQYKDFMEFMKGKDPTGDPAKFLVALEEYLSAGDNVSSLGMLDGYDNPYQTMDPKDVRQHLSDLMDLNEFLWYSQFETLPKEVFPNYTQEDNRPAMLLNVMEDMYESSKSNHETFDSRSEYEQMIAQNPTLREFYGKNFGWLTKEMAREHAGGWNRVNIHEMHDSRHFDDDRSFIPLRTAEQQGFMFNKPLHKKAAFFNRGINRIHRKMVQDKIEKRIGYLDNFKRENMTEDDPILGGKESKHEAFGYHAPWKRDTLPNAETIALDFWDIYKNDPNTRVAWRAAEIHNIAYTYARQHGHEDLLNQNSALVPYFFLVAETARLQREAIIFAREGWRPRNVERDILQKNPGRARNYYIMARNKWLSELDLLSRISRNVRKKVRGRLDLFKDINQLAIAGKLQEAESVLESLTKIYNPETKEGYLLMPTDIHKELKVYEEMGAAPQENLAITVNGKVEGKIKFQELVLESGVYHATDFMRFIIGKNYEAVVSKYLKNWDGPADVRSAYKLMANNPNTWDAILPEDMTRMVEMFLEEMTTTRQWEFDLRQEEIMSKDKDGTMLVKLKAIIETDVSGTTVRSDQIKSMVARNAFARALGGILVRTPSEIEGNLKIALTKQSVLLMFATISNSQVHVDMENAGRTNKAIRTKWDAENQKMVYAEPHARRMQKALGFSMQPQIEKAVVDSEALLKVMTAVEDRMDAGKHSRYLVRDKKEISGKPMEILDLDSYSRGVSETNNLGFGSTWKEAHLSPLVELMNRLRTEHINDYQNDLINKVQGIIDAARKTDKDSSFAMAKAIALGSRLIFQNAGNPMSWYGDHNWQQFLDPDTYAVQIEGRVIEIGKEKKTVSAEELSRISMEMMHLHNEISGHMSENGFIRDNQFYWHARSFAFEWMQLIDEDSVTSPESMSDIGPEASSRETIFDRIKNRQEEFKAYSGPATSVTQSIRTNSRYLLTKLRKDRDELIQSGIPETDSSVKSLEFKINELDKTIQEMNNDPVLQNAFTVGENIDNLVRDVFRSEERPNWESYRTERDKPYIDTEEKFNKFIDQMLDLKKKILETDEIMVDKVMIMDTKIGLRGEFDVLTRNRTTGEITIYDVKTKKQTDTGETVIREEKKSEWSKQLSLYNMILWNEFGVRADKLAVIPVAVEYGNQEGDATASVAELKDPITINQLETVDIITKQGESTSVSYRGNTAALNHLGDSVEAGHIRHATSTERAFISWLRSKNLWNLESIPSHHLTRIENLYGKTGEAALEYLAKQAIESAVNDQLNIPSGKMELDTLGDINPLEVEQRAFSIRSRAKIRKRNFHRKYERMEEMANETGFRPIRELNQNIQDMVDEGNIDERQARMMRKLIVNMYLFNPMGLQDLKLEFMKELRGGRIDTDTRTGRRTISIGGQARRANDRLSPVLILAHELAHQGAMEFIMNDPAAYHRFEALMNQKGHSLMTKLYTAWHGGIETADTKAEVKYAMENVDEFIASLGSFYLLGDFNTLLKEDFTVEEHSVLKDAMPWLSKVFGYMRRIFEKIGFIWSEELQNPDVNRLMNRLFGFDLDSQTHLLAPAPEQRLRQSFEFGPEYTETHSTKGVDESFRYDDAVFEAMVKEYDSLSEQGLDNLSPEQVERHNVLHNIIRPDVDSTMVRQGLTAEHDTILETGLTRYQFFSAKQRLYKKYGRSIEKIGPDQKEKIVLDIKAMRQGVREGDLELSTDERLAAMQVLIEKFKDSTGTSRGFGNQVSRKAGAKANAFTKWFDKILDKVLGTGDHNTLKRFIVTGQVGPSGAGATYNAMHIIPVWFTALLDDQIVSTMGSWTNLQGTASLSRNMEKLRTHQNSIHSTYDEIEKIFGGVRALVAGKISESRGEQLKGIHLAILLAVDSDNVNLKDAIKGPARVLFDNLSAEKQNKVLGHMQSIADDLNDFMNVLIDRKKSIGDWGNAATNKVGWKFNEHSAEGLESLRDSLSEMFIAKLRDSDYIDPVSLFALGYLPDFGDSASMVKEMEALDPNFRKVLIEYIAYHSDEQNIELGWQGLKPKGNKVLNETEAQKTVADFQTNLMRRLRDGELKAIRETQEGLHSFMRQLTRGNIAWAHLSQEGVDVSAMRRGQNDVITGSNRSGDFEQRLMKLYKPGKSDRHAQAIGWMAPEDKVAPFKFRRKNPIDVHVYNLINRAGMQMYLPNDAWFVPSVAVAATLDSTILDNIVTHPTSLINDYMKGIADEVTELMLMIDNFEIYGTIGDALNLFAEANTDASWRNMDGTQIDRITAENINDSITTLRDKYKYIRGIRQTQQPHDPWKDFFVEIAPGITKIAFGGNLSLATITVEYAMNTLTSALGPQGWRGFFKALTALGPAALGTEEFKETSRDLLDLIGVMTQAHVPDYDRPLLQASSGNKALGKTANFIDGWGNQMMRPSQWIMGAMATSRAQIFRKSVFELMQSGKLTKLVAILNDPKQSKLTIKKERDGYVNFALDEQGQLMEGKFKQSDLVLPDPMALEKHMKDAGINPRKYGRVITYMLRAGFLDASAYPRLTSLLNDFNNKKEKGTYSPNQIRNYLSKTDTLANREEYHKSLDVIGGLKIMEKAFVNEILVNPNAFDINTDDARSERLFEIYRRYGMLFNSQLIMRNANHLGLTAMGVRLITMCALDLTYMMLLRMASGDEWEDIMEDLEDSPTAFFMTYGFRLPIMGRYLNMIGEFLTGLTVENPASRTPGAFISAAGGMSMLNNLRAFVTKMIGGELENTDWINAMRNMPFIGDAMVRLPLHVLTDSPASRSSRRTGSPNLAGGMFRHPTHSLDHTTDEAMRMIIEEMGLRHPNWQQHLMAEQAQRGFDMGRPQAEPPQPVRGPESPVQPVQEQEAPQPTPEPETAETASPDVVGQIGQQAPALEIPDSDQLA